MWLRGNDITKPYESLKGISIDNVYQEIRNGKEREGKEKLTPFIVISRLNSFNLRSGKFSCTDYFCIDIHTFPKGEESFLKWRKEIEKDRYVVLTFNSDDAFHVFFQLRQPCNNKRLFSAFYRVFANMFLKKYSIKEEPGNLTFDPCRIIPLGTDSDAFMRIGAALVVLEEFERNKQLDILKERNLNHKEITRKKIALKQKILNPPTDREMTFIKDTLSHGSGRLNKKNLVLADKQALFKEDLDILTNLLKINGLYLKSYTVCKSIIKLAIEKDKELVNINLILNEKCYSIIFSPNIRVASSVTDQIKDTISKYLDMEIYNKKGLCLVKNGIQ